MEPATGMTTLVTVVTQMTSWFTSMMSALFAEPLFLVVFSVDDCRSKIAVLSGKVCDDNPNRRLFLVRGRA